jgi:hypothetical protein
MGSRAGANQHVVGRSQEVDMFDIKMMPSRIILLAARAIALF